MRLLTAGWIFGVALAGGTISQLFVEQEPTGRSWREAGFSSDPRSGPPGDLLKQPAPQPQCRLTSRVVVRLHPGTDLEGYARSNGLAVVRRFKSDPNVVVFDAGSVANAQRAVLRIGPSAYQDRILPVSLHAFVPDDPYFPPDNPAGSTGQWHLRNQIGGTVDARVWLAWQKNRTGTGVNIGIVDDGIQTAHPDIAPNYDAADSWDFVGDDANPAPGTDDNHGTAVAGVAAARGGNGIGVTGVAPFAGIAGLRIDPTGTESDFADATLFHSDTIGVKNHSYGVTSPYEPSPLETAAIKTSAAAGCINVYSAGNDRGDTGQDTAKKAALNEPGAIVVGALSEDGRFALYSNFGANLFCVAPSSGDLDGVFPTILTTDRTGASGFNPALDSFADQDYTSIYGSTSSAAAVASGVMAMLKQMVPNADARLAKHLLVRSCQVVHSGDSTLQSDGGWKTNNAGFKFNQNYGFGLVNAYKLTELAKTYVGCSPLQTTDSGIVAVNAAIPNNTGVAVLRNISVNSTTPLEEVSVAIAATHPYRGDLEATLTSPKGTTSRLFFRSGSDSGDNVDWTFTSNAFWGENPKGTWKLRVFDRGAGNAGTWDSYRLMTRGGIPLPAYDAKIVKQTVPTSVLAGAKFPASIRIQNLGYNAWDSTVALTSQNPAFNTTWGRTKVLTKGTVGYGGVASYTANFTAPSTPGTYNFQWQLRKTGPGFFGPLTSNVQITVTSASQTWDVSMTNFTFSPKTVNANAGDKIRWTNNDAFAHTVEPDTGTAGMDSDATFPTGMAHNATFEWTVPANAPSGTKYYYHCRIHGTAGNGTNFGTGMTGVIIVN
jgi:kexin